MHQAFLDRMQQSSGYGRVSEPPSQSGPAFHLPVQPMKSVDMQSLQAQAEQTLQRMTALESSVSEVTQRLADWTEVTRTGIGDLRSEVGAVKLEQRFSQTLRSTGGEGSSISQSNTPAPRFSVAESPKEAFRNEAQEVVGEELTKRLEAWDKRISDIQKESLGETASMRERLHAALRDSDQNLSRADELQAVLKEEHGRRALLFARLEAVEASCQDLRSNVAEFSSMPEATERLLRGELRKEMEQMRDELQLSRSLSEQQSLSVSQTEKVTGDLLRRMEDSDSRMLDMHNQHVSESGALRGRVEASVRDCDRQMATIDGLQQQMRDEQRRQDVVETRFERVEQDQREHERLLGRLDAIENTCQDVQRSSMVPSQKSPQDLNFKSEMTQELAAIREELERSRMEQNASIMQVEASTMELGRKQEEGERKLMEVKQDHFSETVQLRGRVEETIGDIHAQQANFDGIKSQLENEKGCRAGDTNALRARIERLEQRATSGSQEGSPTKSAADPQLQSRLDVVEAAIERFPLLDIQNVQLRLKAVEQKFTMTDDTVNMKELRDSTAAAHGHNTAAEMSELRSSLLSSHNDVQRLARDLSSMREEHDQAISSLGSLTELVARTTAAGIQRSEERIAADLTGKREEFERTATQKQEWMEKRAKAVLQEIQAVATRMSALEGGSIRAPVRAGTVSSGKSDDGSSDQQPTNRRIDSLARELRAEAAAQSDAADARVMAAEASFGSDLKRLRGMLSTCVSQLESMQVELSQLELARIGPRLQSVEASLGAVLHPKDGDSVVESISEAALAAGASPLSSISGGAKWVNTFNKVVSGFSSTQPQAERTLSSSTAKAAEPGLRQGLKDKLQGIASSVHQVLGALEGFSDADQDNATVASGVSSQQPSVSLPLRPTGTLEKQLSQMAESGQGAPSSLSELASTLGRGGSRLGSTRATPAASSAQSRAVSQNKRELIDERPGSAVRETSPNLPYYTNTGRPMPVDELSPSHVREAQAAPRGGAGFHEDQFNHHAVHGTGLSSVVGAAMGGGSERVGRGAFTAPQSMGPSRGRSPENSSPDPLRQPVVIQGNRPTGNDLSRTQPTPDRRSMPGYAASMMRSPSGEDLGANFGHNSGSSGRAVVASMAAAIQSRVATAAASSPQMSSPQMASQVRPGQRPGTGGSGQVGRAQMPGNGQQMQQQQQPMTMQQQQQQQQQQQMQMQGNQGQKPQQSQQQRMQLLQQGRSTSQVGAVGYPIQQRASPGAVRRGPL